MCHSTCLIGSNQVIHSPPLYKSSKTWFSAQFSVPSFPVFTFSKCGINRFHKMFTFSYNKQIRSYQELSINRILAQPPLEYPQVLHWCPPLLLDTFWLFESEITGRRTSTEIWIEIRIITINPTVSSSHRNSTKGSWVNVNPKLTQIRKSSKEGKLKFKSYKTRDVIDLEDSTKPRILPPGEKSKPFTRV